MLNYFKTKLAFLVALLLYVPCLFASPPVLLLIDMQDYFVDRYGTRNVENNPRILEALLNKQIEIIQEAKRNGLKILAITYQGGGPLTPKLAKVLEGYDGAALLEKTTQDLFDESNLYKFRLTDQMRAWNVTDFIVIGANGGFCVKGAIQGALDRGINVFAYTPGIGDFESWDFIAPYVYDAQTIQAFQSPSAKFEQFDDLSDLIRIVEHGTVRQNTSDSF